MTKIILPDVMSGYNLSAINSNFQKLEDELNNKVLYRQIQDGEPNSMASDLDMNGRSVLNANKISSSTLEVGGVPVVPKDLVADPYNGTREALRRSYAEAGYFLVDGSFEVGGTLTKATDVLLYEAEGKAYSWGGTFNKPVPSNSTPSSSGGISPTAWIDQSGKTNRRKIVILATGQSNVQQEPAFTWSPPSNIFLWQWPGLGATGNKFIPCPKDKINHCYASAAELARLNPLWDVYIIKIASGGRPIDHWLPGGSSTTLPEWNAYEDCKNNTEVALTSLGLTKIDYFHWHQGESNINNLGSYTAKWKLVFDRFCGETWFKRNTRVLINGVTSTAIKGDPNYAQMNMKLRSIVRDSPSLRTFVPTAEIVPLDLWLPDGLHMSGGGHLFLGTAEAQMLQFGGALPVPQGYAYDPETGNVCLGGAAPAAGGTVEVNKGSMPNGTSYNARTSLDVINTQTDSADIVSMRVIGANGTYSVTSYGQGALANTARIEWTGTSQMQNAISAAGAYTWFAGATEILRAASGILRPGTTDNTTALGSGSNRWSTVFAGTGTINTSDAREKTAPLAITDSVLDAWGDVQLIAFQWLNSIQEKGEDVARWHFGVIAQQVRDALAARGLDGTRYGLLCYDEWEAQIEVVGKDGEVIQPAVEAGHRWGIRPDQCLFLEAAYQRRRCDRIEDRLSALELTASEYRIT